MPSRVKMQNCQPLYRPSYSISGARAGGEKYWQIDFCRTGKKLSFKTVVISAVGRITWYTIQSFAKPGLFLTPR